MVKVAEKIKITTEKINALDFDAHWYRRAFHAFGASLIFYYMLPDVGWINVLKIWVPPFFVLFAVILEILRVKGKVSKDHFFGLRMYEEKRIGSYVFFAVGILILFLFFPQQIAIPCILCVCLGDPVIGELRRRFGMKHVYIFGFLLCMFFFMVAWYKSDIKLMLLASVVGGVGAVAGEIKKFKWLDDDFMIQMVPAVLLLIVWVSAQHFGLNLPGPMDKLIHPLEMTW